MDQIARGSIAAAAAAVAVGGLAAAIATVTPSLPEVQVRDFGLAASLAPTLDSQIETVENHIQQASAGGGEVDQAQVGLGDLLFDHGDGAFHSIDDQGFSTSELTPDQDFLNSYLGSGFDPQAFAQGLIIDPSVPGININGGTSGSGLLNINDQEANAAAANLAVYSLFQGLPAAYQAFGSAVGTAELAFNGALVDAQAAAVARFGADSPESEIANWIFNLNNTILAHDEASLNSLLGVQLDPSDLQNSLLTSGDPSIAAFAQSGWDALQGLNADDFTAVVHAIQADNLFVLLGNIDWSSIFGGLF